MKTCVKKTFLKEIKENKWRYISFFLDINAEYNIHYLIFPKLLKRFNEFQ